MQLGEIGKRLRFRAVQCINLMDRDSQSRSREPQRGGRTQPAQGLVDPNDPNFPSRESFMYYTLLALALLVFLYVSIMFIPYAKQPEQLDFIPRDKSSVCTDCIDSFTNVTREDQALELPVQSALREPTAARESFIRFEQVTSLVEYERIFTPLFSERFRSVHFEALEMPVTAAQADAALAIGASNKPRRFIEQLIVYLRRRHTLVGWIRRNMVLWTEYDNARLRYDSLLREIEIIDAEIRSLLSRKDGPDMSAQLEAERRRLFEEQATLRRLVDTKKRDLEDRLQKARSRLETIKRTNLEITKRKTDL